jgi:hypothetical protein
MASSDFLSLQDVKIVIVRSSALDCHFKTAGPAPHICCQGMQTIGIEKECVFLHIVCGRMRFAVNPKKVVTDVGQAENEKCNKHPTKHSLFKQKGNRISERSQIMEQREHGIHKPENDKE